ncbi:SET domain protein [Cordyceps fumosorosea ARSEF 2679]|uniref:SET domain protein n=1 Tax=Cordyceps fumosorosea (strain ARSEF 2679) TaxID=1081104 RepID=A0A167ZGN7_CORFA|nr:SET domain protein [Cordyceps fumosorosea ARSEF 2679]OAA67494.1 SET domain protein [Cordyceps fumosorosea ARSEF 2679]
MTTAAKIDALVAWAESHGAVLHPSVEVYHDAATGLSFRVKPTAVTTDGHPALPGNFSAAVVRLPSTLSLSYLNAIHPSGSCPPLAAALRNALPPHVLGRLLLVREYLAGASSFWHPYLQCLPQPGGASSEWRLLPPFWDDDDAELLDGTNLEVGLARVRGDLRREIAAIQAALRQDHPEEAEATDRRLADRFTPDLYRWAYAVFSSRSFRPSLVLAAAQRRLVPAGVAVDDFSVLLPLLDVGNHDMTAPVRWSILDDGCELRPGRAHAAPGEQVFNNYGAKTNAELLLGYGFAIPPSAALHNDYVHVRSRRGAGNANPGTTEEYLISARPLADASSVLARGRLPPYLPAERAGEVTPAFQHVAPEMAWDIFAALAPPGVHEALTPEAGADEVERRLRFLTGRVGGACLPHFARTAAVMRNKLLQELERLRETDVEVGEGEGARLTACQRLALEYRERCRGVLEGALESMDRDRTLAAAMEAMDEEEQE